jgi:pyrimidine-specific ribonucleoside hydrolase
MKNIKLLLLIYFLLSASPLWGHKAKIPVIIDTDVALDDIRAITLLNQSDEFIIEAIVTSDGACSPRIGAFNISTLLEYLEEYDVPVGYGKSLGLNPPPWRSFTESVWDNDDDPSIAKITSTANEILSSKINEAGSKYIYICLGPMTNLAELLEKNEKAREKMEAIYYRGTDPSIPEPSWNTARDKNAVEQVMKYEIPVYFFKPDETDEITFDSSMLAMISLIDNPACELIGMLHHKPPIIDLVNSGHFGAWDEALVLSIIYPSLVDYHSPDSIRSVYFSSEFDEESGYHKYFELLEKGGNFMPTARKSIIFTEYPKDKHHYRPDIQPVMEAVLKRFGEEEWNSILLTSELHRHLGIYSILGAKMGVYAREILDASLDELQVTSYAGNKTPLSCFNDGLQVSTGATLGHGLIQVMEDNPRIEVVFEKNGTAIHIRLKQEVVRQIEQHIENALKEHGGLNQEYFEEIRTIALEIWQEFDRKEIFLVTGR